MASITTSLRSKGSISITNNSISFQGTVIPIRNIARLTSFQISRKRTEALIYGACAFAALGGAATAYSYGLDVLGITVAAIGVVFAAFSAASILFKRYGLHIETCAGSKDFVVAKSRKFAEEVLALLWWTIENAERPVSFVVNQDNKRIYARDGSIVNVGQIIGSTLEGGHHAEAN